MCDCWVDGSEREELSATFYTFLLFAAANYCRNRVGVKVPLLFFLLFSFILPSRQPRSTKSTLIYTTLSSERSRRTESPFPGPGPGPPPTKEAGWLRRNCACAMGGERMDEACVRLCK